MDPRLERTLRFLLAHVPEGRDDWWLIGSGALSVMGTGIEARDVDLLTTAEGAAFWLKALNASPALKAPDAHFRSVIFKSIVVEGGLELEIMGALEVSTPEGWRLLAPRTRQAVQTPAGTVFTPEASEMLDILHLFGRPKDMDRARILSEFKPRP